MSRRKETDTQWILRLMSQTGLYKDPGFSPGQEFALMGFHILEQLESQPADPTDRVYLGQPTPPPTRKSIFSEEEEVRPTMGAGWNVPCMHGYKEER